MNVFCYRYFQHQILQLITYLTNINYFLTNMNYLNITYINGINGNFYFRLKNLIKMNKLIAQNNGIVLNVGSKNVVFGAGGGHMTAYFNLKGSHPLVHFGIGGLMGAYTNKKD